MEDESFENQAIAKILNDHFVSIKVDREERPDVDRVYMTYLQVSGALLLRDGCRLTDARTCLGIAGKWRRLASVRLANTATATIFRRNVLSTDERTNARPSGLPGDSTQVERRLVDEIE